MKVFRMQDGPNLPWEIGVALHKIYERLHPRMQDAEKISNRGGFGWAEIEYMWRKVDQELKDEVQKLITGN